VEGAGTHFDPRIVKALVDIGDDFARFCRELADPEAVLPSPAIAASHTSPVRDESRTLAAV
jgi:hypothetical protein